MTDTQTRIEKIWQSATGALRACALPTGFVASSEEFENYHRIWSRDACISGLASWITGDAALIEASRSSILALAEAQASSGQIPSNIPANNASDDVSYGGLAGRVDATTWWIIGASLHVHISGDHVLRERLRPHVHRAFEVLRAWEFNDRGMIFTPLGGNWADEYISQGHVLYDQLLYCWALKLASKSFDHPAWSIKSDLLRDMIALNFGGESNLPVDRAYHPRAFAAEGNGAHHHWWFSCSPAGYDKRWDMAANALALLLNMPFDTKRLAQFIADLSSTYGHGLLPVFYPVIEESDPDWHLLRQNYSFQFKNFPHHFHNGGSWPVFSGLLSMALSMRNEEDAASLLRDALVDGWTEKPAYHFPEYYNPKTREAGGKNGMAFTASGFIFALATSRSETHPTLKSIFSW